MEKLLILSDIHLSTSVEDRDRFAQVLQHAMSRHGDARALVLAGDLTEAGKAQEYSALARMLARVSLPVIPMTGNLDRRRALIAAFPKAALTDEGHVQAVLDLHRHRIITLDTLDGPPYAGTRHGGRLCPDRIAWLIRALDSANGRHKVVIAHHPAMKIGAPGHDAIRLDEGAELLELLASYPGTHLICGHTHRAASGISRGVPWSTVGSVSRPFALSLESEEIRAGDQPPSYGVLLLQKQGIALHHQELPT